MSACLIFQTNNSVYYGSDSASSAIVGDIKFRVSDDCKKIYYNDNRICFCSGNLTYVEKIKDFLFGDITHLSEMAKYVTKDSDSIYFDIEIVISELIDGVINTYQISKYNNYDIVEHVISDGIKIFSCGIKTQSSADLAEQKYFEGKDLISIYKEVFNEISDNSIGGNLSVFSFGVNGVKVLFKNKIKEVNIQYIKDIQTHSVVADAIVGKLIAGNSLTISNSNNKFIVNATGCTLVDSSMTVTNSTNKSRVLIDPTNGIKIQSNATGSWIDRLYADVNGNLVISAALSAATGTFSGTVSAGAIVGSTINGGSIAIGSRFAVDSLGNMTATNANFSGNITGSTINVTTDTKIGRKLSLGYTGDLDDLPGYQGIHFANVFSPEFGGAYIATQVTTEESLEISGGGFGVTFNDYAVFTENVNFSPSTTVNLTGVNVVGFEAGITSISGGIGIDVVEFDPGELSISLDRLYTDDRYLRNDGTNTYGVATRDSSAYQDLSIAATLTGITIRSGSTVLGSIAYT